MRGYQLLNAVDFLRKIQAPKVNENAKIVYSEQPVLPSNEWQIRPLLRDLQHDGERIHVWAEVANSGEKITASLAQRKGYSGLSEGPWPGLEHFAGAVSPASADKCAMSRIPTP